jgi:hypothetical protein
MPVERQPVPDVNQSTNSAQLAFCIVVVSYASIAALQMRFVSRTLKDSLPHGMSLNCNSSSAPGRRSRPISVVRSSRSQAKNLHHPKAPVDHIAEAFTFTCISLSLPSPARHRRGSPREAGRPLAPTRMSQRRRTEQRHTFSPVTPCLCWLDSEGFSIVASTRAHQSLTTTAGREFRLRREPQLLAKLCCLPRS